MSEIQSSRASPAAYSAEPVERSASTSMRVGSKSHSSYAPLAPLLRTYPAQSGPLFHAYTDLTHVARWEGLRGVDLRSVSSETGTTNSEAGEATGLKVGSTSTAGSGWGALLGRRPDGKKREVVLPCHVTDHLSVKYFNSVFRAISELAAAPSRTLSGGEGESISEVANLEIEAGHILLAILSPDSTVVYYKLAKGLVKPVN